MSVIIRTETHKDYREITRINDLAFEQKNEGVLVESIRKNPAFIRELSIVAEKDHVIVGHILFFPVEIVSGNNSYRSASLAPMSVHPGFQRQGIGGSLIRYGLQQCKVRGFKSVTVLGHPEYYTKFGFERASKWHIRAPIEVPDEAFMAIELVKDGLKGVSGVVEFPREYDAAL